MHQDGDTWADGLTESKLSREPNAQLLPEYSFLSNPAFRELAV